MLKISTMISDFMSAPWKRLHANGIRSIRHLPTKKAGRTQKNARIFVILALLFVLMKNYCICQASPVEKVRLAILFLV